MKTIWSYPRQMHLAQSSDADRSRAEPSPDGERQRRRPASGRVLRVKDGYNPNSSSIGSAIPGFLTFAVASGAVAVLVLNVLDTTARLLRKQQAASSPPTDPPRSDGHAADDPAPPEDP